MQISVLLVLSLGVAPFLAEARPQDLQSNEVGDDDIFGDNAKDWVGYVPTLDQLEEQVPKAIARKLSHLTMKMSEITYLPFSIYESHKGAIYAQSQHWRPFIVNDVSTVSPIKVFERGSLAVKGAYLRIFSQLSISFRSTKNVTITSAQLHLQLETEAETSSVRTIYLDTLQDTCPQKGFKHICESKSDSDALTIGPFPIPAFAEIEIEPTEVASLHIWVEDEEEQRLLDTRIFVARDSPIRE